MWLPLTIDYIDTVIVPPLDVYWVWHCHMLAPIEYDKDCNRLVGTVIDHRFLTESQYESKLQYTQTIWENKYPDEPFEMDLDKDDFDNPAGSDYRPKSRYNVLAAAARQQEFYYQVSLPHYKDRNFLQAALKRYQKFLFLKKKNPAKFLVPCYDFDIIWHTHQLNPLKYKIDTEEVLGEMLNHDDSVNDRSSGSRLNQADEVTRELWKKTFDEEFSVCGGMYRGESPFRNQLKLHEFTVEQMKDTASKRADVTLAIESVDPTDKTMRVNVYLVHKNRGTTKILKCKYPFKGKNPSKTFEVCTSKHLDVAFQFQEINSCSCITANGLVGEGVFPVASNLETKTQDSYNEKVFTTTDEESTANYVPEAKILAKMENQRKGPTVLNLTPGQFRTTTENILDIWGPIQRPSLSIGVELTCCVANHV